MRHPQPAAERGGVCDGIMCAENTQRDPAPIDQSQDPLRTLYQDSLQTDLDIHVI